MVKISIITVSWNKKKELLELISSLTSQKYVDKEIIIVDNDSTDGTKEEIKNKFKEVNLLELDKNYGLHYALNKGFEVATGEIFLVVDNDCIFNSKLILFDVLKKFRENKNLGIAAFQVNNFFTKEIMWDNPLPQDFADKSGSPCVFNGCAFAIHPKTIRGDLEPFYESLFIYGGELDFTMKVVQKGFSCLYFPDLKVYHKMGTNSQKETLFYNRLVARNRILISIKNYSWPHVLIISLISFSEFFKKEGLLESLKLMKEINSKRAEALRKRKKISKKILAITKNSNDKFRNLPWYKKIYRSII